MVNPCETCGEFPNRNTGYMKPASQHDIPTTETQPFFLVGYDIGATHKKIQR